jgi:hypothetical protein
MVDEYENVDRTMEQCISQSMQAGAGGEAKAEAKAEAKEEEAAEAAGAAEEKETTGEGGVNGVNGENVVSGEVSVSDQLVSDEDRCVGTDALEAAVTALINATDTAAAAALDKFEGWEPHHQYLYKIFSAEAGIDRGGKGGEGKGGEEAEAGECTVVERVVGVMKRYLHWAERVPRRFEDIVEVRRERERERETKEAVIL